MDRALLSDVDIPADPGTATAEKSVNAVDQIVQLTNPLQVIAFGSRARGDHRPDSDLDLAGIVVSL